MLIPITVDFKGSHYPKDVVLYAVFFYVRYAVAYRDLEGIMAERGVAADHAAVNRGVGKLFVLDCRPRSSTKIHDQQSLANGRDLFQVKGKWAYFYRAVDKFGKLQIPPIRVSNIGWHRSGAYDPQPAIQPVDNRHFSNLPRSLHNRAQRKPFLRPFKILRQTPQMGEAEFMKAEITY